MKNRNGWRVVMVLIIVPSAALLTLVNQVMAVEERPLNRSVMMAKEAVEWGSTLRDGGFEGGTPSTHWAEASVNYETPICYHETCGKYGRNGSYYVWFGGIRDQYEASSVTQMIEIEAAEPILSGYVRITDENGSGVLQIAVDGTPMARFSQDDAERLSAYEPFYVDMTSYSDGDVHELELSAVTAAGGVLNFFVDDVAMIASEPTAVRMTPYNVESNDFLRVLGGMMVLLVATIWVRR